jgi:hypothetical protein
MPRQIDWVAYEAGRFQEARYQFFIAVRIVRSKRPWHNREQMAHSLHPAVKEAFEMQSPVSWQQMLLEWPHVATTDPIRIAYTRDERAGIEDRQTVTTIGKYLKRHWPQLSDHTIRDLVAKYGTALEFKIERGSEAIVRSVQSGPSSCMKWDDHEVDSLGHHPYEHYDPAYGWHTAVGYKGHMIVARALLMQRDNLETAPKYFVRTYEHKDGHQYSQACEEMTQWLLGQGYAQKRGWNGERLAFIGGTSVDDEVHAPYIDGAHQEVEVGRELDADTGKYVRYLRISDSGEYEATSTNGKAERTQGCSCDACGDRIREDDVTYVGRHADSTICQSCLGEYKYVTGRRGEEYWVHDDKAVEADGDWYDVDQLSDNSIVQLHDVTYTHEDNATYVDSQSEYYPSDEVVLTHDDTYEVAEDCVQLHDGDWALEEDAWQCAATDKYYLHDEVEPVEVDGENYHPDEAPEPTQLSLIDNS